MTLTLNLSPEQERRLHLNAQRSGKSPETYLIEVVDALPDASPQKEETWGESVIAEWRRQGIIGDFGDPNLSSEELAQQFKERAAQRWEGIG